MRNQALPGIKKLMDESPLKDYDVSGKSTHPHPHVPPPEKKKKKTTPPPPKPPKKGPTTYIPKKGGGQIALIEPN